MQQHNRANKKWNTNEILRLQREYELLELSVVDIAARHGRSVDGIAYKLKSEGFIVELIDARGYYDDMPALIDIEKNEFSTNADEVANVNMDLEVKMDVRMTLMESCLERIQASLALLTMSKTDSMSKTPRLKLNR